MICMKELTKRKLWIKDILNNKGINPKLKFRNNITSNMLFMFSTRKVVHSMYNSNNKTMLIKKRININNSINNTVKEELKRMHNKITMMMNITMMNSTMMIIITKFSVKRRRNLDWVEY